ncbi:TetR/AcrR family transcriptional regulator [Isoptericola sp. F-RaC21]|uniref:TetR/AcrR family transcriptional regulator n=1 Tax=Isoptericola sp. F-RaC21 TaxID=3141452 RepID=UPI00315BC075
MEDGASGPEVGTGSGKRPRPGGRSARVREDVFAATLAELVEVGYTALTIERVAARAGVHKTTVYRRWEDKDSLLVAAVSELAAQPVPAVDTGGLRSDLFAYASAIVSLLAGPVGRVARTALTSDAMRVPGIAAFKDELFATRRPLSAEIVRRAVERGELDPGTDPHQVIDFLVAPVYFRLMLSEELLDDELARQVTDATVAAARAGAFAS